MVLAGLLDDFIRDVRYSLRALRRTPIFALLALATLTLTIGANTAIFSLVDPLLFRALPVPNPGNLVQFTWRYPGDPPLNMFSLEHYERYRDRNTAFSDMVGLAPLEAELRTGNNSISADVVTGNFFHALAVRPVLGRVLNVSDDAIVDTATAVVSWQYWQSGFNGETRVLGANVEVSDRRLPEPLRATVVGVAAPGFTGVIAGRRVDVWLSASAIPAPMRSRGGFALIARLKPGVSIAQARAEMRVLDQPRIDALAERDPQWRQVAVDVTSARTGLSTPLVDQFGGPLSLLTALVGLLLLLACANLGGMFLARATARQPEIAVRVSLGAGRSRIVRQLLAEAVLLASIGGVLGLVAARFGATTLMRIVTSGTQSLGAPQSLEVALDARVLSFTIGATVLAAIVFGLVPALTAFASVPATALRHVGAHSGSRSTFGNGLVVAQVVISLALLSVSHVFVAHLRHLRGSSLGFNIDSVLLLSVNNPRVQNREQLAALYRNVVARLEAVPGVTSVAASGMTPISGAAGSRFLTVEGFDEPAQDRRRVFLNPVSPNYFATYGTPLLAGRDFRNGDMDQPRRLIINQAVSRRYFSGRSPVGRHVWLEGERDPYEIVGVAGDAKYQDTRVAAPPIVYPFALMSRGWNDLSIRTSAPPTAVAADARRIVNEVFGTDSVGKVTTLADQVNASIVPERVLAILAGFFGALGALLAAIGLFGVLAYAVSRRTKEIGIRVALGATTGHVIRMIAASAGRLVCAGVILGAPAAFWSTRLAASVVVNLPPGGAAPIAAATAILIVVALVAGYVPARRAIRIEPIIALRAE
jgi:predicted permease